MFKFKNPITASLFGLIFSAITMTSLAASEAPSDAHKNQPQRLILLKFKPRASQVQIDKLHQLFTQIQQQVSGVTQIDWRKDKMTDVEKLYSHAITINFSTEQDIKIYEQHPKHLELISVASPLIANYFEMNY